MSRRRTVTTSSRWCGIGGYLNVSLGWRATFALLGLAGVFVALLVLATSIATLGSMGAGVWIAAFFIRVHGMPALQVTTWLAFIYGGEAWSALFSAACSRTGSHAGTATRAGKCGFRKLSGRKMTFQGEELCAQEVARQPDAMASYVCDDAIYQRHAPGGGEYYTFRKTGAPTAMANTLPELAKQMENWGVGMSAEAILHDIGEYNQAASNARAWALPVPKTSAEHAIPLLQPPFYAILGQAGITATHGGIRVNTSGQVLHRSGRPIQGLFAAGVDIGNFNNCTYLGNLNLGAAYGYVSGANAAKQRAPVGGRDVSPALQGSG